MININLQNAEELILKDKELRNLLPELRNIFDKWLLSYRLPGFVSMRKEAILELLNAIKDNHLSIIEQYFKNSIAIERIDYKIVRNLEFKVDDNFCEMPLDLFDNFTITRNADKIYISTWR